ncbi:unnamed protein product [Lactuca virosa]|uniref:Uncharacterized protein n=1 Tax=Lactuca virosa TaxID=75947 RepID=A0AAU9M884_9ASTR|nr:unnamed protein product [Lactuca virosa]
MIAGSIWHRSFSFFPYLRSSANQQFVLEATYYIYDSEFRGEKAEKKVDFVRFLIDEIFCDRRSHQIQPSFISISRILGSSLKPHSDISPNYQSQRVDDLNLISTHLCASENFRLGFEVNSGEKGEHCHYMIAS